MSDKEYLDSLNERIVNGYLISPYEFPHQYLFNTTDLSKSEVFNYFLSYYRLPRIKHYYQHVMGMPK